LINKSFDRRNVDREGKKSRYTQNSHYVIFSSDKNTRIFENEKEIVDGFFSTRLSMKKYSRKHHDEDTAASWEKSSRRRKWIVNATHLAEETKDGRQKCQRNFH
jgi:hypothetical protein